MDASTKIGVNVLKVQQKKKAHKAAEVTGELLGNKTGDKIVISKPVLEGNSRNVDGIIIPPEQRKEILRELRPVL